MDDAPSPERGARTRRVLLEVGVGAALGAAAFLGPALLGWAGRDRGSVLQTAVEGVGVPALAGLFVVGLLLGSVGTLKPLLHGFSTMAAMPLLVVVDIAKDSSSHNMLPFELGAYALYALVAVVGAALARALVARARGRPGNPMPSSGGPGPGKRGE